MSTAIIAGLDEAGRGCIAGPVVAGACVIELCRSSAPRPTTSGRALRTTQTMSCFDSPSTSSGQAAQHDTIPLIADSKVLTLKQREVAFDFLTKNCAYGVGIVDASAVDEQGILAATEKAMQEAVIQLSKTVRPSYLLIDGRDHFWFDIPHSSVIRGDEKEKCIAAASIIAKVTRDRLMERYDTEFPGYAFAEHKGYGTTQHFEMVKKKGITPLHRRTFLRTLQNVQTPAAGAFSE